MMMQCVLAALDADACRSWTLRRLHPAGASCPACGVSIDGRQLETWRADGDIQCHGCGKWFNNRTGTPLSAKQITWQQFFLLASLTSIRLPVSQIATACQLSDDTVRRWQRRFQVAA